MHPEGITHKLRLHIAGSLLLFFAVTVIGVSAQQAAPDTLYKQGLGAFTEGDYEQAASLFQELVDVFGGERELHGALEQVYYALGCSLYNLASYEDAEKAFQVYMSDYPQAPHVAEAAFRIAAGYHVSEAYADAVEAYRHCIESYPDSEYVEDALYQMGICLMAAEQQADAVLVFRQFTSTFTDSDMFAHAAVFLARCLYDEEQSIEALEVLEDLSQTARTLDHIVYANFLAMDIGDDAFEETQYELALRAYRGAQTKEYLTNLQTRQLNIMKARLEELQRETADASALLAGYRLQRRLEQRIRSAEHMLAELRAMPEYDAALFHRIAQCYFNSELYWQARVALRRVLEETDDEVLTEAACFDLALVLSRQRRFSRLIEVADMYLERYGKISKYIENGRVPTIAFMRAECFINEERFEEAEPEVEAFLVDYPEHVQVPRAEFYLALSKTMLEKFDQSIPLLEDWLQEYPNHMLVAEVSYWLPVACFYDGQYAKALPLFRDYVASFPLSVYTAEAEYRIAHCLYALEKYESSAQALQEWLAAYPEHHFRWEGTVYLGDALAAVARLDEAKEVYLSVPAEAGSLHYLSLMQCARIFKALATEESYREMAAAFAGYIRRNPQSPNIVDAAYQAGWALRQVGRGDAAQALYWNIIKQHGNNPDWEGFSRIFDDMAAMMSQQSEQFVSELETQVGVAERLRRTTLQARLLRVMAVASGSETAVKQTVDRLVKEFRKDDLSPEELAFIGSQVQLPEDTSVEYLDYLLTEYPDSRYSIYAYLNKGDRALVEKRYEDALALGWKSYELAYEISQMTEAQYLMAGACMGLERYEQALELYNQLLAARNTPRKVKADALLGSARCYEKQKDWSKALAYYQRIYVLYGAYPDIVAQAYLRSGRAFEMLKDYPAAKRTYEEMLSAEALKGLPELAEAQARLEGMLL